MRRVMLTAMVLALAAVLLGACGTAKSYSDPFAYCKAVGTLDAPDARYTGPALPDALIEGMVKAGLVTEDAPADFKDNAVWRCADSAVWICHFGANLPCQEKADTAKEPSQAMQDFCEANPSADVIPASETGRATVYEWRCTDGKPEAGKQVVQADAQGFLADFWVKLTP